MIFGTDRDHRLNLGDSLTSATWTRFLVHTTNCFAYVCYLAHSKRALHMYAFGGKADMVCCSVNVCF
jgi:hypothetical protein